MGIRPSDSRPVSDFEEGSGPNHPLSGRFTSIQLNRWYHAAVSYSSSTGRYTLYLVVTKSVRLVR